MNCPCGGDLVAYNGADWSDERVQCCACGDIFEPAEDDSWDDEESE